MMMDSMKSVLCLLVIFLIQKTNSENSFKSVPVTVKTYENETVLLPCYVDDIDSCTTPEGSKGNCVEISKCPALRQLIKTTKIAPKDVALLKNSACGFDGTKPKVCCPYMCQTAEGEQGKCVDRSACTSLCQQCQMKKCFGAESVCCPLNEKVEIGNCQTKISSFPPNLNTHCCGRESTWDDRITGVGGVETSIDKYPWLSLIEYQQSGGIGTFCGGVLISGKYVLTAAHCVTGDILNSATPVSVRLGEHDTSTKIDCRPVVAGGVDCNEEPVSLPIEASIPHPQYDAVSRRNDIALIRLRGLAPFNEGPLRVRWYKDSTLLGDSMDAHHLLPPRVRMHANYSLQVDSLVAQDTAHYTCEVIRPEPWGPIRQTHLVEVQYSPTVRTIPEDGFLEVRKGEYVDIGCEGIGTPTPEISWKKNGEPMALLEPRSRLRFRAEHRLLAGVYECSATNGVGDPVTANIRVAVLDAPVVSAVRSFVHTAVGLRAALAAKLEFAVPPAAAAWYKDGRPVHTDDRVVIMVQDSLHQLIFRTVRKSDLGNYTFRAENKLGMADVQFKLTGIPNVASFKVDQGLNKPTPVSFTLVWEVDSYSTIIEYNLWIRPYYGRLTTEPDSFTTEPPANHWIKIVVPGDASAGPIHSATYTVRGLTPSTVYEAIVTSRNRFGWSKPSAILHFATEPGAGRQLPSTSDYTDVSPVLEELEPEAHNISQAQVFERIGEHSSGAREISSAILITVAILFFCIS